MTTQPAEKRKYYTRKDLCLTWTKVRGEYKAPLPNAGMTLTVTPTSRWNASWVWRLNHTTETDTSAMAHGRLPTATTELQAQALAEAAVAALAERLAAPFRRHTETEQDKDSRAMRREAATAEPAPSVTCPRGEDCVHDVCKAKMLAMENQT